MKRTLHLALAALALATAFPAKASVTLQFSNFGTNVYASGFANNAGAATDGMYWGIVVDTAKNGFAGNGATGYSAFATPTTAGFLSFNGVATDDYFVPASSFAQFFQTADATGAGNGGHGTIADTTPGNINLTGALAGASSDPFSLIWFNNTTQSASMGAGQFYGMYAPANFVLPNDTQTVDFSATNFSGANVVRSANLAFTSAVPEPSTSLLALLGGMGLMMRRRRK